MNIRNDKKIMFGMGVSLSVIVLAAAILTFGTASRAQVFLSLGLIVAGLLMFVILLHTATKPETELVADERVTRVNEKAGYHAFGILLGTMALVQSIAMFGRLNLSYKSVSPDIFIIGMPSFIILRWYYNRRYDAL